jgi:MoaA/NifB/PqqE/SkfB family radical SAM enzyme
MSAKKGAASGKFISRQECLADASYTCNLFCKYCHNPPSGCRTEIESVIDRVRRAKVTAVSLEGRGEPTTNPRLPELISGLRAAGVKNIMLSTNAVALADKKLCARVARGVDFFTVNFPSHVEEVYNGATRSVKYREAVRGLRNLAALGLEEKIRFFHIIFRDNYKLLPEFVGWARAAHPGCSLLNFTFVRNKGRVGDDEAIVPRYAEAAPYVKIALARAKLAGLRAVIQNMPLCALKNFEGFSFEYQRWRRGDEPLEDGLERPAPSTACRKCTLAPACCGARPDYLRIYGDGELKPSSASPDTIRPERF